MGKRGSRRKGRRRLWWWTAGSAFAVALIGAGAWVGWSWWGTYQQAQAVQQEVGKLRSSLAAQQWDGVDAQVEQVNESARRLSARTQAAPWRLLESMPQVGASAQALSMLASALVEVGQASEPLVPYVQRIVDGQIRRGDGSIDLAALQEVAPLLASFTGKVEQAEVRLEGVDVDAVRPEIGEPVRELRDELENVLPALGTASDLATWLPGLLGADGEREWLILLQNPAEARGSGGFIGGYVIASADDGRISLERTGSSSELASQLIPADSAPADAQQTWGDALERWGAFNVSPHFPMTAALAADGMAAMGQPVDGVIAVDPQGVASLLQITGPVSAMGKTITAEDAAQFFTVDIYREYPDSAERDAVTLALVEAAFQELLVAPWSPTVLVDALREPIESKRVLAWSADTEEQQWLEQSEISGVLIDEPGSVVAVAFNNTARNKMDAFVSAEVDYRAGRCPTEPVQESTLRVRLRNQPPADLPADNYGYYVDPDAPLGTTRVLVHLYVPVDANYRMSTLDGQEVPMYLASERNRPVWWNYIELAPGEERELAVYFEEPTVLAVQPRVQVQPMVNQVGVAVAEQTDC